VLYLAEVQRKARVIGGGKAEFKLLACQRSEQSWAAVPGDEIIPAPDDAGYNAGALVMVDLTNSKQVQRHSEAGRQLVSILQNFSRLQEKFKTQEEEIEQWKQSLTYQSQELNLREMEMETRREQLEQMEEEFQKLEQQQQQIEATRVEVERLREEFDRKNQELEGAWAQLHGELHKLEERQSELRQTAVLEGEQAIQIQELLSRLSGAVVPTESVREQLNFSFEAIAHYQQTLDHHWQTLEQQRNSAQQVQAEVDQQAPEIQSRWQAWHEAQDALERSRSELLVQQHALSLKQTQVQALIVRSQNQDDLYQQVCRIVSGSDKVALSSKVDLDALEQMSIDELQKVVHDLQRDLEKVFQFVNVQEEELSLQQEAIDTLTGRIQEASEYDRLALETELADEQDRYRMLNETLVGQRRSYREREQVLQQHQTVLDRRQGKTVENPIVIEGNLNLEPIMTQIEELRQQQAEDLQELQEQIQQIQAAIEQAQSTVDRQAGEQELKRNELKQLEQQWQAQKAQAAELWGKVNTYQETLQPTQDNLNSLKERLEAIANLTAQFQETSDYQLQAIAEMRQTVEQLTNQPAPELATLAD
jgi:chromosome segregation ATPase